MIDVFRVGVHIAMTTNGTQVLGAMLTQLTGLKLAAGQLEGALGKIATAAVATGAVFVGWKVLDGLWHAIENSRELNKELEKTKQLGGDFAANIEHTRNAAIRAQGVAPTSVLSGNVRLGREIGTTIGKPEAADEMIGPAAKTAYVVSHYTGEKEEHIIKNLVRIADLRGKIYKVGADGKEHVDPVLLQQEMDAAAKGLELAGGFISSSDMLQAARQGGAVVKGQTAEAFYAAMTEASIAMGAARAGTAETSLMNQFVGGTMTKKVAEHLTEAGLLHEGEWHSGGSGGVVVDPKAARRFEPMIADPIAWLSTGEGGAAVKAYAAKEGISVIAAIMQLFGRQTTQRLAQEAMSNEPQFARAREIYSNIPSVAAQYQDLHEHDLDTNIREVAAAWKSFTEAFSDAATPMVIPFLHALTGAIQELMKVTADHPEIAAGLTGLAAGIASLTVLGGSLALLNLCWAPLATGLGLLVSVAPRLPALASGLTLLGGGLTTLAAILTGPVGAAIAVLYAMKPSATNKGEDEFLKAHRQPDGTLGPSPYIAPAPSDGTGKRSGDVYLDGKKVGDIIQDRMANSLSRPPTGSPGPDYRVSPLMPGQATAFG